MDSKNLYDLIISRRTIREFQDKAIKRDLLEKFVNDARLAPQAANRQPLEFIVVDDPVVCTKMFSLVKIAGYLDWKPAIDKMPRAYIAIVANTTLQKPIWIPFDVALASGNICLTAWEEGIGSCLIGAFDKWGVTDLLNIPQNRSLSLLVALGYPAHKSYVEETGGEDMKYWRDDDGTFHVPKRPLKQVIHHNRY